MANDFIREPRWLYRHSQRWHGLGALGPAERSRVMVTAGVGTVVERAPDGSLHANSDVFYLQPNDGKLAPREARGVVLRRWVEFPRRGVLLAIPVENVSSEILELYPEGPPILAEESLPLGAGWLSPLKATLFAGLGLVVGAVLVKWSRKKR